MKKFLMIVFSVFLINTNLAYCQQVPGIKSKLALYWQKLKDNAVQCWLCPRKCVLKDGQRGFCTVRVNKQGSLYTLGYANPVALHIDPIEKKPFFHVAPGEQIFSLAVAGCNMRCLFCQNWQISQSKPDEAESYYLPPLEAVNKAVESGSRFIAYTYTEPTVFYEYMLDIAKIAKEKGLKNTMHSCGYINPEPLKELLKYMYAVNVDLKGFSEEFYAKMGSFAELTPVLETLKTIKNQGVWLEITNLLIPGLNDDPAQIEKMCRWIKDNLGDEVPLHFSRFMPAFKLENLAPTPIEKLDQAYAIAKSVGLKYVYIGNVPGNMAENTFCPKCGKMLVKRLGYEIQENNIVESKCKFCGYPIAGRWDSR